MLRYEASTVGKIRCFVPQHDSTETLFSITGRAYSVLF